MLLAGAAGTMAPQPGHEAAIHNPRLIIPPLFVQPPIDADELLAIETPTGRIEIAVWHLDSVDVSMLDTSPAPGVTASFAPVDPSNPDFSSLEFLADTRRASDQAGAGLFNPGIFDQDPDPSLIAARVMLQRGVLSCDTPKDKQMIFSMRKYKDQQFVEAVRCSMAGLKEGIVQLRGFGSKRGHNKFIRLQPDPHKNQPFATICNLPKRLPAPAQVGDPIRHFHFFYDVYLPTIVDDPAARPCPALKTFVDPVFCLMASLSEA